MSLTQKQMRALTDDAPSTLSLSNFFTGRTEVHPISVNEDNLPNRAMFDSSEDETYSHTVNTSFGSELNAETNPDNSPRI